jgi:hypothetical protein
VDFAGTVVDSHDRRLRQHDAAPADVDERIGCSQVDGDVACAKARKEVEETDDMLLSVWIGESCYMAARALPNPKQVNATGYRSPKAGQRFC